MNLGLIGFGGVGKSFLELIHNKQDLIPNLRLKYIIKSNGGIYCDTGIDISELIDFINNGNSIENHTLWETITIDTIIKNRDIDCLIELTSTNIHNGEPGYTHIKKALQNNISVVTGNKGPILLYYKELKEIADNNNVHLKVGCTTGGALPSINVGVNDTLGSKVLRIDGILNGTTNFILEEMEDKQVSYKEALEEAKRLKIAELNPSLDIEGFDTAVKLLILAKVVMNIDINLDDINIEGITKVTLEEILSARKVNKSIKLLGSIYINNNDYVISVGPKAIDNAHPLYNVCGKNKGVSYKTDILGDITVIGGASSTMGASASIFKDLLSII